MTSPSDMDDELTDHLTATAMALPCRDQETRELAYIALRVWQDVVRQGATEIEALAMVYHAGASHYREAQIGGAGQHEQV